MKCTRNTKNFESVNDADAFINETYDIRYNKLSDKVEYRELEDKDSEWLPVTEEAINTMTRRAKKEGVGKKPKPDIKEYIFSTEIPQFDPIVDYVAHCPKWDGEDRITPLFTRIPGITPEQIYWASKWLLSAMAHWLHMDNIYGNQCIFTLIGEQGCGKSTLFKLLLPPEFREKYYLDRVNLSNKFDKDMALTNNLITNIDELDQVSPRQQASLKQLVSKPSVNGRPIYGRAQVDRERYCSFTATTDNRTPLIDKAGSRRFIIAEIPKGEFIDKTDNIDYPQLYSQLAYQVTEEHKVYWFTNEEVARIQEANLAYYADDDLCKMLNVCFRKPSEGDEVQSLSTNEVLDVLKMKYPSYQFNNGNNNVLIGMALSKMGFQRHKTKTCNLYQVVQKAA